MLFSVAVMQGVASAEGCENNLRSHCKSLNTCPLCRAHHHCDWDQMICSLARNKTSPSPSSTTGDLVGKMGEVVPLESGVPSAPPMDQADHRSTLSGGTQTALSPHRPCDKTCAQRESCSECTEVQNYCIKCSCIILKNLLTVREHCSDTDSLC